MQLFITSRQKFYRIRWWTMYCWVKWHHTKQKSTKLYDMIWYDMIWYDMIWYDMIWHGMIRYDMIWYDMIWHDMIWYDMIWLFSMICIHIFKNVRTDLKIVQDYSIQIIVMTHCCSNFLLRSDQMSIRTRTLCLYVPSYWRLLMV